MDVKTAGMDAKTAEPNANDMVKCALCEHRDFYLADHIAEAHGLTVEQYLAAHPGAPTVSASLLQAYAATKPAPKRQHPPEPSNLEVEIGGVSFPVNGNVPLSACLPCPPHYAWPQNGNLLRDVQHALVSLNRRRSIYVWGLPGSGKDALFHAWSAMTRTPAAIFQIQPGTDIQSWFYFRDFSEKGTSWGEGELLKALRDGYVCEDGTRVPMMVLISDFDRADKAQAEYLRLITDSIEGRVKGPGGVTYKVLDGTIVVATANSSGAGDERNRCISANPLDSSLFERFERKFEFHYMDWADEVGVVRAKFPLVQTRAPDVIDQMGKITTAMRASVEKNEIYCEFSHRAVCSILGHIDDILHCSGGKVPKALLRKGLRAWTDGLPDQDTRDAARKIIDSHVTGGAMDEGDTSHIKTGKESMF